MTVGGLLYEEPFGAAIVDLRRQVRDAERKVRVELSVLPPYEDAQALPKQLIQGRRPERRASGRPAGSPDSCRPGSGGTGRAVQDEVGAARMLKVLILSAGVVLAPAAFASPAVTSRADQKLGGWG